jgi:hypothetical protein
LQLEPQLEYVLARGLEDHTDSTTYYVRAVIRNAKTDALIATVNLTDNGNRRFTKAWLAPADPTGLGLDILVTYTVYTDSGYTTKAENYGEKFDEHTVLRRMNPNLNGGGADVDYKRIAKIVSDEVAKQIASIPDPDKPEMPNIPFHLQPLLNAITGVRNDIGNINVPEAKEVDFGPVMAKIQAVEQAVNAIDIPTPPETDLSPVLDRLDSHGETLKATSMQDVKQSVDDLFSRVKEFFAKDIEEVKKSQAELVKRFDRIPYLVLPAEQSKQTTPEEQINYAELLKR